MTILGREKAGHVTDAKLNAKHSNGSKKRRTAEATAVDTEAGRTPKVTEKAPSKDPGAIPPENANTDSASQRAKALQIATLHKSLLFTQIVSILMRSPRHKHYSLADLEWLILPPLQLGQLKIAETKAQKDGPSFPGGFLLWAKVSPEVDKRLSQAPNVPMRLRPDEWQSGETLWLIETVGEPRILKELLKHFRDGIPEGRDVKLRATSRDGKTSITTLGALQLDEQPTTPVQEPATPVQ